MTPEWTFSATETSPDGIRVTVTVIVPTAVEWHDVREVAEIAQMGASHTSTRVGQSRRRTEEAPF